MKLTKQAKDGKNTRAILAWCAYDWGISAFPVIVTTFVIATYFTTKIAVNEIEGTHQWGDAMALAGVIIAILSPVLGAIADYHGHKKYWLGFFTLLLIFSSALLWYASPHHYAIYFTLLCVVLGTVGMNTGMVFYNALLTNIAPRNMIGRISGWGWGIGYFGGLLVLIIAYFGLINSNISWLNTAEYEQVRICGPLVALWTAIFAFPLFIWVPDPSKSNLKIKDAVRSGLSDLLHTLKQMPREKTILTFLIAQMIYIDGLNTLFAFGGIYAAGTFHMSLSEVLVFGIVLNAFAGLGSILLAWVDDFIGPKPTILISLLCLIFLGLGIVLVSSKTGFWILASCLSLFVGPVQSSSRSMMAHLVPKEKANEMFGFYSLSGKVSTFLGPWVLSSLTLHFNSQRVGMASVIIFFVIGGVALCFVKKPS